jgi:hypothetical protein
VLRVAIVTTDGRLLKPEDVPTAVELQRAIEQARNLIRECERLAVAKAPAQAAPKVPYA